VSDDQDTNLERPDADRAAKIESDIAETRDEMTGTVEAIGERLDPATIIEGAKHTVREATVGKVEDMASTASNALNGTVQDAGSDVLQTIRRNPIPAALAGLGIAWLWTHRADGSMTQAGRSSMRRLDAWDPGYGGASRGSAGGSSEGIVDSFGDAADSIGQRVSDVGDTVGRLPSQVGDGAGGVSRQAQRLFDESPLAVGALAVAVGAAISMALPVTRTERRALGPVADQVVGSIESGATAALQKMQESTPDA
jgi:hypothetical protein